MIRISILYPNVPGGRFDWPYYQTRHMPRSIQLLGGSPGFLGVSVERGVQNAVPGSPVAHLAICQFSFESLEAFQAAFAPHAAELQGDMPAYTDIQPIIQVNEVLISTP